MVNGKHGDWTGSQGQPVRRIVPRPAQDAQTADTESLGQAIVNRLFSAGLDLASVRTQIPDGPVADRLSHAVSELDEAIIDLRRLMLAVTGIPAASVPGWRALGCRS